MAKHGCFSESNLAEPHTTETCLRDGFYLGNNTTQEYRFTIVDTPGFGESDAETENRHVNELVDTLKNDLRWAHAFVITFKGTDVKANR